MCLAPPPEGCLYNKVHLTANRIMEQFLVISPLLCSLYPLVYHWRYTYHILGNNGTEE